jgi:hypothetical protein
MPYLEGKAQRHAPAWIRPRRHARITSPQPTGQRYKAGGMRAEGVRVLARLSSGDGPLSVRGWPLQRQGHPKIVCNRFAEMIFRTTLERRSLMGALHPLRPETKGQAAACPDRTRAIACKVRDQSREKNFVQSSCN